MTRKERRHLKKVLFGLLMHGGSVNLKEAVTIEDGRWGASGIYEDLIDYENHETNPAAEPRESRWWITEEGKQWLAKQEKIS